MTDCQPHLVAGGLERPGGSVGPEAHVLERGNMTLPLRHFTTIDLKMKMTLTNSALKSAFGYSSRLMRGIRIIIRIVILTEKKL